MKMFLVAVVLGLMSFCFVIQAQTVKTYKFIGRHHAIEKNVDFEKDSVVSLDEARKVKVVCRKKLRHTGRIEGKVKFFFRFDFINQVDSLKFSAAIKNIKINIRDFERQFGRAILIKRHLDLYLGYAERDWTNEINSFGRVFTEQLLDDSEYNKKAPMFYLSLENVSRQLGRLAVFSKSIFGARLNSVACSLSITNSSKDTGDLLYLIITDTNIRNYTIEMQRIMKSGMKYDDFPATVFTKEYIKCD